MFRGYFHLAAAGPGTMSNPPFLARMLMAFSGGGMSMTGFLVALRFLPLAALFDRRWHDKVTLAAAVINLHYHMRAMNAAVGGCEHRNNVNRPWAIHCHVLSRLLCHFANGVQFAHLSYSLLICDYAEEAA